MKMKKLNLAGLFVLPFVVVLIFVIAHEQSIKEHEYVVDAADFLSNDLVASIPAAALSQEEETGLLKMREEEKLARDVYGQLYDIWGARIFLNIASSEQTHTDAVKILLDRYELEDPVQSDARGVYTDPHFTELYGELVRLGELSLEDALHVGATIEDLDIADLDQLIAQTDNQDILTVYSNLQRGSENHMRAFVRQLESRGGKYTPQYISQSQYEGMIR